ncbi:GtrA family protein [Actinomadura madurae]|uniref:GtrA family protein n=1 Tax=Actinomadura madurae TaxID=1993 RepID=UPI00202735B1|nr:GtrA family protein [Actinomadura madurae]URM96144.1 GtrA family protein [Actinomadura madurae]URN06848.1 GtrA family protein [Actinomadura madurae]
MSLVANLHRQFEHLVRELAKFGSVGAIAFVITVAIGNGLHTGLGVGPLTSNGVATLIATTFSYLANRYWTFRHRDRTGLGREYVLFFALNGVGLVITELFIGFSHYVLGLDGAVFYNIALVIGTGVATLFRFWSYKKWVFLPASAPQVAPASGLPEAPDVPEGPGATRAAAAPAASPSPRLGHPLDAHAAEDYAEI